MKKGFSQKRAAFFRIHVRVEDKAAKALEKSALSCIRGL
jgi:hypothetical protein